MKKTYLAISAAAILLLVAGCGKKTDNSAAATSKDLTTALKQGHFAEAQGLNQALLNADKGSKKLDQQLSKLTDAQQLISKQSYAKAIKKLNAAEKIDAGNTTVVSKIEDLISDAKEKKANVDAAKAAIQKSEQALANHQYKSALQSLTVATADSYQQRAYSNIYTKALELKLDILAAQSSAASTTTKSTEDSHNQTSQNTKSQATSSASTSNTMNDGNNAYSASASSSSKITAADIAQARKDLTAAGENSQAWSDSDISTAIINARAEGRSHIKATDLK